MQDNLVPLPQHYTLQSQLRGRLLLGPLVELQGQEVSLHKPGSTSELRGLRRRPGAREPSTRPGFFFTLAFEPDSREAGFLILLQDLAACIYATLLGYCFPRMIDLIFLTILSRYDYHFHFR